jgi:glutaryl-CoA dehydrogenase (non-decarboxylating)
VNAATGLEEPRRAFARFASEWIAPFARASDRSGALERAVIDALRREGFLGCLLPAESGGLSMDHVTYGLLTAEVARVCSSARTLMTVHGLVETAVQRWGSVETRSALLPELAAGRQLGAFALSEPRAGSDAGALETEIRRDGHHLVISGEKSWVSFGQIADIILLFGRSTEGITAVLIPGDCPNLVRVPVGTMVGTRGSMMAHLRLDNCRVPARAVIGRPGFGFSHVAAAALDHGRYSVAWGAVGIIDACLHACAEFTRERAQFSSLLKDQPLMRARLTRMAVMARAGRLLCTEAGRLRDVGSPAAIKETMAAKYFASKAAVYAANEAVQIHGARGLMEEAGVERLLRDAKVTEIIEGSSDILELLLGESCFGEWN